MEIANRFPLCTGHRTLYGVMELNQPRDNFDGLLDSRILPVHVLLNINLQPFNQIERIYPNGVAVFSDPSPDPFYSVREERAWIDASCFSLMSDFWAYFFVSQLLDSLGIGEEDQENIFEEIHLVGNQMVNNPSNRGSRVLPLFVTLRMTRVHVYDERVLVGRATARVVSTTEFEETRSGMILIAPAESALDRMLKKVKVPREKQGDEDDATCAICLQEFDEGLTASKLPCSHIFHPGCIMRWLKQKQNCPMCRIELPIC